MMALTGASRKPTVLTKLTSKGSFSRRVCMKMCIILFQK